MDYIHLVVAAYPVTSILVLTLTLAAMALLAAGNSDVAAIIEAAPAVQPPPVEERPPVKPRSFASRHELRQQIAHEQEEAEHRNMEAPHGLRHD